MSGRIVGERPRRYAVIGSRDYPKLPLVSEYVRSLSVPSVIVSGGARGVDETAVRAARAVGHQSHVMQVFDSGLPDDPEERRIEFGKRAYARNTRIVEWADEVVAFWTWCARSDCPRGGQHVTHGTAHAISEAGRLKKPLRLIGPDGSDA